jgi:hypothetical protein
MRVGNLTIVCVIGIISSDMCTVVYVVQMIIVVIVVTGGQRSMF